MVGRRAFGAWAAGLALEARAQAPVAGPAPLRVAWVSGSRQDGRSSFLVALREGLAEIGRVDGRNVRIEPWWGDDTPERLDSLVAEMLRSRPDVIVTQGPVLFAIQRSGTKLPVVFAFSGDPIEGRLIDSMARPGGNLTGVTMMALELVGKRIEALIEAVPGVRRIAVVSNPAHAGERRELAASQAAAARLGLETEYLPFRDDASLDAALAGVEAARCHAIVVFPDASMMRRSERFADFANRTRIPAVSGWSEFARRGNLMSYGPNVQQVFRRLAWFVDRILKGARPADLPAELPTVIEHVINLRAARAIGIAIPQAALLRADEVIE